MGGQDQEIKDCPPALRGVKKAFYTYLRLDRYFLSINANYLFSLFSHSLKFPGIQLPCKLREDSCVMFASLPRAAHSWGKMRSPQQGCCLWYLRGGYTHLARSTFAILTHHYVWVSLEPPSTQKLIKLAETWIWKSSLISLKGFFWNTSYDCYHMYIDTGMRPALWKSILEFFFCAPCIF